jgi:hypothetical protein
MDPGSSGKLTRVPAHGGRDAKLLDDGFVAQSSANKSTTIAVSKTSVYYVVRRSLGSSDVIIRRIAR